MAQGASAGHARDGRRGESDETDDADHAGDEGTQRHSDQQAKATGGAQRHADAGRALVFQAERCQRAYQQHRQRGCDGQTWRQVEHAIPAALVDRAGLPQQQINQVVVVEQYQQGVQRVAVEADHHAGQDETQRRQMAAPGEAEQGQGSQAGPSQRHDFQAMDQQRRCPDGGDRQGEVGAGRDAQGHRFGQRIAQNLLEQGAGQAEGCANHQTDQQAWREAEMQQYLIGAVQIR